MGADDADGDRDPDGRRRAAARDGATEEDAGGGIGGRVQARGREGGRGPPPNAVAGRPVAVFKKFGDDRGGNWAALIAYYGFFSLFPLLLAFTTVLGFVVQGNAELQARLLDTRPRELPRRRRPDEVKCARGLGRGAGRSVSWAPSWAGMGVVLSVQSAMDDIWDVPRRARPNFIKSRLRALLALMAFGLGTSSSGGARRRSVAMGELLRVLLRGARARSARWR